MNPQPTADEFAILFGNSLACASGLYWVREEFVDLGVEPGRRTLQLRKANGEIAIEVTEELFSNQRYDFDERGLRAN